MYKDNFILNRRSTFYTPVKAHHASVFQIHVHGVHFSDRWPPTDDLCTVTCQEVFWKMVSWLARGDLSAVYISLRYRAMHSAAFWRRNYEASSYLSSITHRKWILTCHYSLVRRFHVHLSLTNIPYALVTVSHVNVGSWRNLLELLSGNTSL
jgi:hypothetical protein